MFETMRKNARETIVETLEDGYEGYGADFHNEIFNKDFKYTDTTSAIEALEEDGVFQAIGKIVEYEKDNFGEINTDFTNPCSVANMLYYIVGEEELNFMFEGCSEWDEFWNEEMFVLFVTIKIKQGFLKGLSLSSPIP